MSETRYLSGCVTQSRPTAVRGGSATQARAAPSRGGCRWLSSRPSTGCWLPTSSPRDRLVGAGLADFLRPRRADALRTVIPGGEHRNWEDVWQQAPRVQHKCDPPAHRELRFRRALIGLGPYPTAGAGPEGSCRPASGETAGPRVKTVLTSIRAGCGTS